MLNLDLFIALPANVLFHVVNEWLPLNSLGRIDSATVGTRARADYLKFLSAPEHLFAGDCRAPEFLSTTFMRWVLLRNVKVSDVQLTHSFSADEKALVNDFFKFTGRYLTLIQCDHSPHSILVDIYPCIQAECPALETLVVRHIESSAILSQILKYCRATIRELEVDLSRNSSDTIEMDFVCPNLRTLTMCDDKLSQFNAAVMRTCPNLETLRVHPCTTLVPRLHPAAPELPFIPGLVHQYERMRELDVSGTSITDTGLQDLASRCPNLTRFGASRTRKLTDTGITALTNACKNMQNIDISTNFLLTDHCLSVIAETYGSTLTVLNVADCSITGAALNELLTQCQQLKSLNVGWNRWIVETGFLDCPSKATQLEELNVDNIVTDEVLCAIAEHFPQLRRLSMCSVGGFTAAGVFGFLLQATQLRELVVSEQCTVVNQLTKLVLEHFCPHLQVSGVGASGQKPKDLLLGHLNNLDEEHVFFDGGDY